MKEVIKNIFDKVEFSIIVFTIYLVTIFFSLIPESIIKQLSLLDFKTKYQFIFSICFVVLTCYYIALLAKKIIEKINNRRFISTRKKLMKKISPEQKQYIIKFYNFDEKRFDTSAKFDISDAIVTLLEHKQIICRGSNLSVGFSTFSYFLQPWAQEYLNEQVGMGNIVVKDDKISWK